MGNENKVLNIDLNYASYLKRLHIQMEYGIYELKTIEMQVEYRVNDVTSKTMEVSHTSPDIILHKSMGCRF
jgi:hypothetical protein